MLEHTEELFDRWQQVTAGTWSRCKFRKLLVPVQRRVKELLDKGSECGRGKIRGTCRQRRTVATALWALWIFECGEGVEPTSKDAERAVRRAVLWRRKFFGTQRAGSRFRQQRSGYALVRTSRPITGHLWDIANMKVRETEAIILRSYKLAEADKIIVCFSREMGILRGTARGARKLKSKFGASLEPYTLVTLSLYEREGKELLSIRHAELIRSYFGLAQEYQIMDSLAYLANLLIEFAPPHEPSEKLYRLVKTCIDTISQHYERAEAVIRYFEIWLLKLSGFMPETMKCNSCRGSLNTGGQAALREGAVLCQDCRDGQGMTLARESLLLLNAALRLPPLEWTARRQFATAAGEQEIAQVIHLLISRALERGHSSGLPGRTVTNQCRTLA